MSSLNDLIKLLNCSGASDLTMVVYNNSQKKKIPADASKLDEFFSSYIDYLESSSRRPKLGELTDKKTLPLIGNFLFKFNVSERTDYYYSDDFIEKLVSSYQSLIEKHFRNTHSESFTCFVLESEETELGEEIIINLRLQFPYCQVDKEYYNKIMRKEIESELKKIGMEDFHVIPKGHWNTILKDYKESIPLYGSMDDENYPALLKCIYLKDVKYLSKEDFDNSTLFDPEEFSFILEEYCDFDLLSGKTNSQLLPLFLSIYFCNTVMIPYERSDRVVSNPIPIDLEDERIYSDDEKDMFSFLIELLSINRIERLNFWLDVGRAIYNIFEGSPQGIEEWKKFTAKGKRNVKECESYYYKFNNSHLSIKTIAFYARQDDPENYKKWHAKWCERATNSSLSGIDRDVAMLLWKHFWLEYYYSPRGDANWYKFNGVYLKPCDENIFLRNISINFSKIYENLHKEAMQKAYDINTNEREKKELMHFIDLYWNMVKKLGRGTFQRELLKQSKQFFIEEEFTKVYDSDPYKIACTNCVLEVTGNEVVDRPGKPEDFITKCTEIMYKKDYNWNHPEIKKVLEIFRQMMVGDVELNEFFWIFNSSLLRGRNFDKKFPICTGEGDNGKSIYAKFLQYSFGSYCVDMPVETISGKGGKGGEARPDLAQAQGTRVATVCEPSNNSMQSNIIKKFTGNDRQWQRTLFDKGGAMEQLYKLILMCNDIPNFSHVEKAVISRVLIIPFLAKFSHDAPDSIEDQYATRMFKRDDALEDKIPELAQAFLWICVQYYPKYSEQGLRNTPAIVKKVNTDHWEDRDFYKAFIKENMIREDGESVSATDVCKRFREWYTENYYNDKNVTATDKVREQLKTGERLGPLKDRRWEGWKLREMEGDE